MSEPVSPLAYHRAVARILEQENPKSFAALTVREAPDTAVLEQELLRSTYRLDPTAHPDVHAAAARAAAGLGITVPLDLYADGGRSGANAELLFVPTRAVLVFTGDTLEILDADELCSVAGHELAHHLLWTAEGGRYLAAARLLDAAESDARTPSEYLETARRYRLATELFADRGALAACGTLHSAVSGLVKMTTGLRTVDPTSYLRQAAEVDFTKPSAGVTHPETVLRAWALQEWVERPDTADGVVASALTSQLDLSTIDVVGQDELAAITRDVVAAVLATDGLRGEDAVELAGQYGVELPVAPVTPPDLGARGLSVETTRYLAAVLVDFATADPDAGVEAQALALALGDRMGLGKETEKTVVRELGLSDRARTALRRRTDEIVAASNAAPTTGVTG